MEPNALYYTLSTICQTLAGAFGFLVAILLYQMQGIVTGIKRDLIVTNAYRGQLIAKPGELNWEEAIASEDWHQCLNLLKSHPINLGLVQANSHPEVAQSERTATYAIEKLDRLKSSVRRSAGLTFSAILVSLVLIPFSGIIAAYYFAGWLAISLPLALAIASLGSYWPLVSSSITTKSSSARCEPLRLVLWP